LADKTSYHLLAKPAGAACNLRCDYCFFLSKAGLYPGQKQHMTDSVLETYLRQLAESQPGPVCPVAWQGGEPTLMGLDFFRRSIELEHSLGGEGVTFENSIQTNGTLLDEEWCQFLAENGFLVGISLDSPCELHDAYRKDPSGGPTFDRVMRGVELLKKRDVDFNILCTVNATNASHPPEVYRFFRDELDARYIQLIPIVERDNDTGFQEGDRVTARSVDPAEWGTFLNSIFDEWMRSDVGEVFVMMFDWALASWAGAPQSACIFAPTCGRALTLEHNGDLYSCDHYVEPGYLLGNITDTPLARLVNYEQQEAFGRRKQEGLPAVCRDCRYLFACNGACPKDRLLTSPDGEPGLNYLCEGYRSFLEHVDEPMKVMAGLLAQGRAPSDIKGLISAAENETFAGVGRNEECPCGSGLKFKRCHG